MIKHVVFDIGRVLLDYQPMPFLRSLGFSDEDCVNLNEIVFRDDLWLQLDRGIISLEEAIAAYCKAAPEYSEPIERIMHIWPSMLTPIEGTPELLKELRAMGLPVYLLSNFQEDGFRQVYHQFDFIREVDGRVISYEVKSLKPEKEIYDCLLEKYHLIPEETAFIDDMKENIAAAKTLGIKGIVFENAEKTRLCLKEFGIAVK